MLWSNTCEERGIKEFVKGICRVCWEMVVLQPPMEFRFAKKYDAQLQELAWNSASPDTTGAEVINVYPMLYHGNELMSKGKVFLMKAEVETYKF